VFTTNNSILLFFSIRQQFLIYQKYVSCLHYLITDEKIPDVIRLVDLSSYISYRSKKLKDI
jgi:hypothetical protein